MTDHMWELLHRLRSFFRREELDRDFDAEMASHLELATAENLEIGRASCRERV